MSPSALQVVSRVKSLPPSLNSVFVTTEAVRGSSGGRSSGEAQLVEFAHAGSSQSFPEHGRRQSHDPQTTSDPAGEGEGSHAGGGAEDGGGQ